jgi:hypothetical protein
VFFPIWKLGDFGTYGELVEKGILPKGCAKAQRVLPIN